MALSRLKMAFAFFHKKCIMYLSHSYLLPNQHTYMDRQSQQLVAASVVAFLTSGVITLAGLSTAQTMMPPMDGGTMMQQPSGGSYMPPSGGDMHMAPSGDSSYQQPSGGSSYTQPTSTYTQPSGSTNTYTQPAGGVDYKWDGQTFQKDGAGFQKDGANYQQGKNFRFEGGEKPGKDWSPEKESEMRTKWEKSGGGKFDMGKGGTTAPAGMGNDAHMGDFGDFSGMKGKRSIGVGGGNFEGQGGKIGRAHV